MEYDTGQESCLSDAVSMTQRLDSVNLHCNGYFNLCSYLDGECRAHVHSVANTDALDDVPYLPRARTTGVAAL